MNGYRSRIYEMHDVPGGLMTAWERKGYTIDYCIHWLVGSSPSSSMHKLWSEVGLLRDLRIVDLDVWFQYEDGDGQTVVFWRDVDRLEAHLCELSPADAELIKRHARDVRRLARADMPADMPPRELMRLRDTLQATPSMLPWLLPTQALGQAQHGRPRGALPVAAAARRVRLAHARADGRHGAARDHGVAARRQRRLPAGRLAADGAQPRAPLPRARRRAQVQDARSRGS